MTTRVAVSPDVLEWALERSANPEAVLHALPKVAEWLENESQPTVKQLESFAKRTRTPFGYLLLDQPPAVRLPIADYRDGFDAQDFDEPSSDLMAVLNQSLRRQDWYREYAMQNGLQELAFVGSAGEMNAKQTAAAMREQLRFEVADRRGSWSDQRRYLLRSFEDLGGLTVATWMVENNNRRMLDPNEFRGFSLIDKLCPLIFINTAQTMNGQIFTIAHELAHVWRGEGGIGNEDLRHEPTNSLERWCNDVASEFLVPENDLRSIYQDYATLSFVERLDALARRYRCGTLVILQALRRTRLEVFDNFDTAYGQELKRLEGFARSTSGRGSFFDNQPPRIGERFSRAIIGDTLAGRTSLSEALRLTSLKSLSSFDKYARYLQGRDA